MKPKVTRWVLTMLAGMVLSAVSAVSWAQSFNLFIRVGVGYNRGLVGRDLNGRDLNGRLLDGRIVTGVSLNGVTLRKGPARSVSLVASRFEGEDARGRKATGDDFIDAVFTATLDNGLTLPLKVEDIRRGEGRAVKDVRFYDVSYATQDGPVPLCGFDENDEPVAAIPMNGRWNYREGVEGGGAHIEDASAFTFACVGDAIAKCVEGGYMPWKTARVCSRGHGHDCEWTSLEALHQACTRMLRADFCGDGTPYTVDDTLVNLYDGLGIRYDSEDWPVEAEWDADGAICAVRERIADMVPACMADLVEDGCGAPSHLLEGALIISEVAPTN
ncbi:MAG: ADYC domain-containing protein [Deltaproteobacteria bacterium]|nr:ADYC domain-containing protein [Deltaproteobacteria bacterium]